MQRPKIWPRFSHHGQSTPISGAGCLICRSSKRATASSVITPLKTRRTQAATSPVSCFVNRNSSMPLTPILHYTTLLALPQLSMRPGGVKHTRQNRRMANTCRTVSLPCSTQLPTCSSSVIPSLTDSFQVPQ